MNRNMSEADSYKSEEKSAMPEAQSEIRLLARAKEGDAEAFGDLYERYLDMIYRYVSYRVGKTQLAEDLTETVFLKCWQNLSRFRIGQIPFRAWLYRLAHNLLVDHYRTRRETRTLTDRTELIDPRPRPEQVVLDKERSEYLAQTMTQLKPEHQHVLSLRFISGLSHAETAEVLGRSEGAVRALQHRALRALRKKLERRQGG